MSFKNGDIIEYANELHVVVENHGSSGWVKEYFGNGEMGDTLIKFWWSYDGEQCKLVGHLNQTAVK